MIVAGDAQRHQRARDVKQSRKVTERVGKAVKKITQKKPSTSGTGTDEASQIVRVPKTENCSVPGKKRSRGKAVKKPLLQRDKPEGETAVIESLYGV